jgi:hypothetical protein
MIRIQLDDLNGPEIAALLAEHLQDGKPARFESRRLASAGNHLWERVVRR